MTEGKEAPQKWRSRIVGHGEEDPEQLVANPRNWRIHPQYQQEAVQSTLDDVGWVRSVLVNRRTGFVIDGHLRIILAMRRSESSVPVEYVELTDKEEQLMIAALDSTTNLAVVDVDKLLDLSKGVDLEPFFQPEELLAYLDEAQERAKNGQNGLSSSGEGFGGGEEGYGAGEESGAGTGLNGYGNEQGEAQQAEKRNLFEVFEKERIVEEAFQHFRRKEFPFPTLPTYVGMQQINRLAVLADQSLLSSTVANGVANPYHPQRYGVRIPGKKTLLESFAEDKNLRRALQVEIENGLLNGLPSVLGLVLGTQVAANFRPGFALYYYRKYAPQGVIFDCSMGFGGRLVGFLASDCQQYIGVDPAKETFKGNQRLVRDYGAEERVTLLNAPIEDADVAPWRGQVDLCFTSPPYFGKEEYADEETQSYKRYPEGEQWRSGFLRRFFEVQAEVLKPGGHAVVNIADVNVRTKRYPLTDWTRGAAEAVGFIAIAEEQYPLRRNNYGANLEEVPSGEPVFVFQKPKEA